MLAPWLETGVWSAEDHAGDPSSGSVAITNDVPLSNFLLLRQCVPVVGNETYSAGALVRVAPGQAEGAAFVAVAWWSSPTCAAGSGLDYHRGDDAPETGEWLAVSNDFVAPAAAQGADVQLTVGKFEATGTFAAYFDEAFLPEPTCGTELAALTLAGLAWRRSRFTSTCAARAGSGRR
jgi:hypothetical protein